MTFFKIRNSLVIIGIYCKRKLTFVLIIKYYNIKINMSSQDSEVNSQEMAEMEELVRPQNTTNSTHWGVAKFETW